MGRVCMVREEWIIRLTNKPNKKRLVRRLHQRWMDRVRDDLRRLKDSAKLEDAEDWNGWRALVKSAKGPYEKKKMIVVDSM